MDKNRGGVGAVGAVTSIVTANFTRPSNTTTYTAGDAVADLAASPNVITFADVGRIDNSLQASSGEIVRAKLVSSSNPTTKGSFELWLFHTAPTANEDNAAFDPSDAEVRNVVAIFSFSTAYVGLSGADAAGNTTYWSNEYNYPFVCATGDPDLYGLIVCRNAYVPVSAERFDIDLFVRQD